MQKEKQLVRELAAQYFEAAHSDRNQKNIAAHKAVNALQTTRPIVLIDELPWEEMNFEDQLTPTCTDPFLRGLEMQLKSALYRWNYFPADMVLPPYLGVPKIIHSSGCGLGRLYADQPGSGEVQAHLFADQIKTLEDINALHNEQITYDQKASEDTLFRTMEVLGDVLPVKLTGEPSGYGTACKIWDDISVFKSLDSLLYSLIDEPELMHALAAKLCDILLDKYRQYDEGGLWDGDAYYNHSTSALCDQLKPDHSHVTRSGIWGRGLAQIFATVSPAMHEEFDITYQKKALAGFGLNYYGCCEPLDKKIDIVAQIPNLRKISITPWADIEAASEIIGQDYVVSVKPNPALLSGATLDEEAVRKELYRLCTACKRHGCSFELVLKDISTVGNRPRNLFRWEQIARQVVEELF